MTNRFSTGAHVPDVFAQALASRGGMWWPHGRLHRRIDLAEAVFAASGGWTYEQAALAAAISVEQVIPGCTAACIKAQLDDYHVNQCQIARDQPLRATVGSKKLRAEAKKILEKNAETRTPAYQK